MILGLMQSSAFGPPVGNTRAADLFTINVHDYTYRHESRA